MQSSQVLNRSSQVSRNVNLKRTNANRNVKSPKIPLGNLRGSLKLTSTQQKQNRRLAVVVRASVATGFEVGTVNTTPIEGQKTGTSGLRKKTKVFTSENYLNNWIQSLFNALGDEVKGQVIGLGGDGRYFNKEASQIIIKMAAANGFKKVIVGKDAIMCTPAMSALIRNRKIYGGLIMSASHNPGGPEEDWGIKFNYNAGEPAPEKITNKIFDETKTISTYKMADFPDIDLSKVGTTKFEGFEVEVVDPVADYFDLLEKVFDFKLIKSLLTRKDFRFTFDAMHAVTGAYAGPLFVDKLGAKPECVLNGIPKEDFGGGHPDPNLTYAKQLVDIMFGAEAPDFGAASDGDGDRNMVLGNNFFVSPSDSVALIADNAADCIPYFKSGLKGVARSMPTGGALDRVATGKGLKFFETPTGWKFFGNLMDADMCSICGEESFGTGGDHVREKDGLWAVLAWLSIIANANKDVPEGGKLVGVKDIVMAHWQKYGRNFFSRYDYEGVESDAANKVMGVVGEKISKMSKGSKVGPYVVESADEFSYTDPVDGSVATKQGLRIVFADGSRIIFRLSGTGSAGATIRMYIEQYSNDPSKYDVDAQEALASIIKEALTLSNLQKLTGRENPTVIT